jgi:hypothetical protein
LISFNFLFTGESDPASLATTRTPASFRESTLSLCPSISFWITYRCKTKCAIDSLKQTDIKHIREHYLVSYLKMMAKQDI